MSEPADALRLLAELLTADHSVISPYVVDPGETRPALGLLAAAGERTGAAAGEYSLVVETVREGYLLHYGAGGAGRVVAGTERDLALLAGDYLYALGLERLAAIGDLAAVRELSDLIGLAAQLHDGSRSPERAEPDSAALWLACATAIAAGADDAHERAKAAVRAARDTAADELWSSTAAMAERAGFREALEDAAAGLDFRADHLSSLG